MAVIKILASGVKKSNLEHYPFLLEIKESARAHFSPEAGFSPAVERTVLDIFRELQREIDPLGTRSPEWEDQRERGHAEPLPVGRCEGLAGPRRVAGASSTVLEL